METPQKSGTEKANRVPRAGVRLMVIIVVGLALVAIYANVQRYREQRIERVTIIPFSTATPAAAAPGRR
jgi:hypothetical protein